MLNYLINKFTNKRLYKNISYQSLQIFVVSLIQFLFPILIIQIYNINILGIFFFFITTISLLDLFKLNITSYGTQKIWTYYNDKKKTQLEKILNNSYTLSIINTVVILITIIFAFNILDLNFKIFDNLNPTTINIIFNLILLNFIINSINQILTIGISFKGELYINYNLTTLFNLISRIFIILVGIFINNMLAVLVTYSIANFINLLIYIFYYNKNFSLFKLKFNNKIYSFFKKNNQKILSFSTSSSSTNIKNNLQIFIISIIYGAEITAMISTAKIIFYHLPLRVIGILIYNFSYEYLILFTKKNFIKIKKNYINHLYLITILTVIIVIVGSIFGKGFYEFWLKESIQIPNIIIILILFDASLTIIYQTSMIYLQAINNFFYIGLKRLLLESLIVILFILGFKYFGFSYEIFFLLNIFLMLGMIIYSIKITFKNVTKLNHVI